MQQLPLGSEHVAIVGSRDFASLDLVQSYVASLVDGTVVVSGGARGVDRAAEKSARDHGLQVLSFEPNYMLHGRVKAPFIRNGVIAKSCDRMIAFWDSKSRGTVHAVRQAELLGKPVLLVAEFLVEGLLWAPSTIVTSCSEWRQSSSLNGSSMPLSKD